MTFYTVVQAHSLRETMNLGMHHFALLFEWQKMSDVPSFEETHNTPIKIHPDIVMAVKDLLQTARKLVFDMTSSKTETTSLPVLLKQHQGLCLVMTYGSNGQTREEIQRKAQEAQASQLVIGSPMTFYRPVLLWTP